VEPNARMGFVEEMKAKPARSKSKRLPKRPAPQRNDRLAEWEDEAGPSPLSAREPASEGVGPRVRIRLAPAASQVRTPVGAGPFRKSFG
jgi:hypothetical protein